MFLSLFWSPLWSSPISEQTHVSNTESFCFIQIFTVKKKNRQTCCVLFGCLRICASLGISKPQNNNNFFHLYLFFFSFILLDSFFPKCLKGFTCLKQNNNCKNTFQKYKSFKAMTQDPNFCEFFFSLDNSKSQNLFLSQCLSFCFLAKQPPLNISHLF